MENPEGISPLRFFQRQSSFTVIQWWKRDGQSKTVPYEQDGRCHDEVTATGPAGKMTYQLLAYKKTVAPQYPWTNTRQWFYCSMSRGNRIDEKTWHFCLRGKFQMQYIVFVHAGYFCLGLHLVKSSSAYNTFGQYLLFTVFGEIYVIPCPLTTNVNRSNYVRKTEEQLSVCMCRVQYKTIVDTERPTVKSPLAGLQCLIE